MRSCHRLRLASNVPALLGEPRYPGLGGTSGVSTASLRLRCVGRSPSEHTGREYL